MRKYVQQAFGAGKLALYAKYLDEKELAWIRANGARHTQQWAELVAQVQRQMASGAPPDAPATQALARQWMALFHAFAGDSPATREKIRLAHEQEPALLSGTWTNDAMLAYLRQSLAALPPH